MRTADMPQHLHSHIEVADDKKINSIYIMVEDEIKETIVEHSVELKTELGNRVNYYLSVGKMVSPSAINTKPQTNVCGCSYS